MKNIVSEKQDDVCDKYYATLIDMFNKFFKKGVMASTYKAVFLRSLIDIGKYDDPDLVGSNWIHCDDSQVRLDLDFIAVRFAKYYWDMEVAFDIRHTPERMADENDPSRDVNIVLLVKEKAADMKKNNMKSVIDDMSSEMINKPQNAGYEIQETLRSFNPPTLAELASDDMGEFRRDVIKRAIKPEVLVHLLNDMPTLYERVKNENYIILKPCTLEFMKKFLPIINRALSYVLALHLEKNNPATRYIATKINTEKEFKQILEQVKNLEIKIKKEKHVDTKNTKISYLKI